MLLYLLLITSTYAQYYAIILMRIFGTLWIDDLSVRYTEIAAKR